jgi:hypothetical protein
MSALRAAAVADAAAAVAIGVNRTQSLPADGHPDAVPTVTRNHGVVVDGS